MNTIRSSFCYSALNNENYKIIFVLYDSYLSEKLDKFVILYAATPSSPPLQTCYVQTGDNCMERK